MNAPGLRHPGRWIWLPLLVLIALGLTRLRFDAEIFDLLPNNLPVADGLQLYQRHFANARELIITLQGAAPEDVEDAARRIADQLRPRTNLVESVVWQPPWMEHPEQISELIAYLWFNQPPDVFHELVQRFDPGRLTATLTAARRQLATSLSPGDIARLSYDPLGLTHLPGAAADAAPSFMQGQGLFNSTDGTFRILYVRAQSDLRDYRDCERWLKLIKPLVSAALASSNGQVVAAYTGRPAFVAESSSGMRRDIIVSVNGTSAVIALLFWLAHRRIKPMLWLLVLLAATLGSTLALGGLFYGSVNVLSMGFAAILLGLAVDYAVVHYQEALAHPHLSIPQVRHAIAPSIFWAGITTIAAFLALNFGGLPGLGQMGTLVGLGIALAAVIMIFEYLPPLFPDRRETRPRSTSGSTEPTGIAASPPPSAPSFPKPVSRDRAGIAIGLTAAVAFFCAVVFLWLGTPPVDATADALRPRDSAAYAALDQIQNQMGQGRQPLWLIVRGGTTASVAGRLEQVQAALSRAVSNQVIESFTLSTPLWPRPEFQAGNRKTAHLLAGEGALLREVARTNGFASRSLGLTEGMLATWRAAGDSQDVFWPTNALSQWILDKAVARTPTNYLALGLLHGGTDISKLSALAAELSQHDACVSGWALLGRDVLSLVQANLWKVLVPMILLVLLSLCLAFRHLPEVLLGLVVLALSGLCTVAVMRVANWSWNLLNLMAVPLILGTGVDYSLFTLLALRRHHGDLRVAYRSVGRALLLCGGTAIAAFASLTWSSNAGMASLGEICAVGIACNMLIAVFLLPVWWQKVVRLKS